MATNIDKALFQQPKGIESLAQDEEAIEIEIIDPEEVNIEAGPLSIHMEKGEPSVEDFDANLADYLSEGAMATMVSDLAVASPPLSTSPWMEILTARSVVSVVRTTLLL